MNPHQMGPDTLADLVNNRIGARALDVTQVQRIIREEHPGYEPLTEAAAQQVVDIALVRQRRGWFVEVVRSNIPEHNDTEWENILIGPWPDTIEGQKAADHHAEMSCDVEDWCYGEAKAKGYNVDEVLIVHNPTLIPSYGVNAPILDEED